MSLDQMNALATDYVTDTEFTDHTDWTTNPNPHNVTFEQVGASELGHTHTLSEITDSTTAFNTKMDRDLLAPEGDFGVFDSNGDLKASGRPDEFMDKVTYDPQAIVGDAFNTDNLIPIKD